MDVAKLFELYSPPCPVCAGEQFELLASNDRYAMGVSTAGCVRCGLVQTWPRPTPESMAEFYREHYRRFYQASPVPDADYTNRYRKEERLRYTANLLIENAGISNGMRILDVGCAEGTLFRELCDRCPGLVCVGVEPSESFAAHARESTGCSTYAEIGELVISGEPLFDVIVVNHVLEHVDHPVHFLRSLRDILQPGGRVYVDVPDIAQYASVDSLHVAHLFHFSQPTLLRAMGAAGFRASRTELHAPPFHPPSIWAVAKPCEHLPEVAPPDVPGERAPWSRIRRINTRMPLYVVRARLKRNRWAVAIARVIRRTLSRGSQLREL